MKGVKKLNMAGNRVFLLAVVMSAAFSACKGTTEKKVLSDVPKKQTFQQKMMNGKCCSSKTPPRFPVKNSIAFKAENK